MTQHAMNCESCNFTSKYLIDFRTCHKCGQEICKECKEQHYKKCTKTYVIKDSDGNYADQASIYFSKRDKKWEYLPMQDVFGIDLYPTLNMAQQALDRLQDNNNKYLSIPLTFKIEEYRG